MSEVSHAVSQCRCCDCQGRPPHAPEIVQCSQSGGGAGTQSSSGRSTRQPLLAHVTFLVCNVLCACLVGLFFLNWGLAWAAGVCLATTAACVALPREPSPWSDTRAALAEFLPRAKSGRGLPGSVAHRAVAWVRSRLGVFSHISGRGDSQGEGGGKEADGSAAERTERGGEGDTGCSDSGPGARVGDESTDVGSEGPEQRPACHMQPGASSQQVGEGTDRRRRTWRRLLRGVAAVAVPALCSPAVRGRSHWHARSNGWRGMREIAPTASDNAPALPAELAVRPYGPVACFVRPSGADAGVRGYRGRIGARAPGRHAARVVFASCLRFRRFGG